MVLEGNKQDFGASRLNEWLARATHGLCAQATERVRKEITAHHAEAFVDLCDGGQPPDSAYALAVEGLGDAETANKAFRKTYLTSWQQRLLAGLSQPTKPMGESVYCSLAFFTGIAGIGILDRTFWEYQLDTNDFTRILFFGFFLFWFLAWLSIAALGVAHAVSDRLRRLRNLAPIQRPSAMNPLYPWLMIMGFIALYIVWRVQFTPFSPADCMAYDEYMLIIIGCLAIRLHKRLRSFLFAPHRNGAWKTPCLLSLYIALLSTASITCLLLPSSRSWIIDFAQPIIDAGTGNLRESYARSSDHISNYFYGLAGIITSVILLVVAIRWTIGLYLLRKDVNDDGRNKPSLAPCPETPLGE